MDDPLIEESRKHQAEQIVGDRGNRCFGRQVFAIDVIDPPSPSVGMDELVGDLGDRRFHSKEYRLAGRQRQARGEGSIATGSAVRKKALWLGRLRWKLLRSGGFKLCDLFFEFAHAA